MTRAYTSLIAALGLLLLSSTALAQDAVYECMEQTLSSGGQCDQFTATNDEHVAAGRATVSFFGTYRTVGTGESLGRRTGSTTTTLFQIDSNSFSTDQNNCPSVSVPNLRVDVDLIAAGPVNNGQTGNVRIINNPNGADLGLVDIEGLAPNTTFTLVMTESAAPNSLPSYLLAEFRTDSQGNAFVVLAVELINAYIGANPGRDVNPRDGIPEGPNAGAAANGAITIAMDFFRVYAADGNANVFGVSEDELSGAIVLTSAPIVE